MNSKRIGRPPKPVGEKYVTPSRILGRVGDADWEKLRLAAMRDSQSFTNWAVNWLKLIASLPVSVRDKLQSESIRTGKSVQAIVTGAIKSHLENP